METVTIWWNQSSLSVTKLVQQLNPNTVESTIMGKHFTPTVPKLSQGCGFWYIVCKAFLPYVIGFNMFVWHEISSSNISRTVLPSITKFYRDIHTDIPTSSHTGWRDYLLPVASYKSEKRTKIPPLAVLGGISGEWFKQGSRNFTHLSRTIGFTNLAAPGWLQNVIKYCTKVRKTGPVRQRV